MSRAPLLVIALVDISDLTEMSPSRVLCSPLVVVGAAAAAGCEVVEVVVVVVDVHHSVLYT